jgi:hypothetical protein
LAERVDQRLVAIRILAEAVRDLHDAARMLDAPLVISDDDAELVSELGHVSILSPAAGR